jgi:hypothetical protein
MSDEQQIPKPYEFIAFAAPQPQRERAVGHDRLVAERSSGRIELQLTLRRSLHVSSGGLEVMRTKEGEEILSQQTGIWRYGGSGVPERQYVVPGSSFKGALRSVVEAITASCVVVTTGTVRPVLPQALRSCGNVQNLCPACRMFGMSGAGSNNYQGQISVADAHVVEGGIGVARTPRLWAPLRGRRVIPFSYLSGETVRGRKFYYQSKTASGPDGRIVLRPKSVLRATIYVENSSEAELGVLIAALGLHPSYPFLPRIGGGKPAGLGAVAVEVVETQLSTVVPRAGRLGAGIVRLAGDELQAQIGRWIAAASESKLLREQALRELHGVLNEENLQRSPITTDPY